MQPAEEGEPRKGYQSPPQSSDKPPDSAGRCEWLSAAMRLAGRPPMRRRGSMVRWLARLFTPAHYWPLSRCTSSGMCRPTSDAAEVSLVWRDDTSSVRAVVPGLHEGCRRTEAWSGRSVEPWPVLPKQLTQSVCLSKIAHTSWWREASSTP